jgi:hypothetical protein
MFSEKSPSQHNTLHFVPEALVTDFLSASQNNDPMLYPGERPKNSYITDGRNVYNLEVDNQNGNLVFGMQTEEGLVPANVFLQSHAVPTMEERIPVLAFGANMSPGSLASKFKKVGREDALIIPTVYASLGGHDVVWSGGPGMNGNLIAILYRGEETADTKVQVGINFLTREQLLVMHATEMNYKLASVALEVAGVPVKACYYVGQDSVYMQQNKPVAIESIPATGRSLPTATTVNLLEDILSDPFIAQELRAEYPEVGDKPSKESYMALVENLKKEKNARTALKKFIQDHVMARGLAQVAKNLQAQDNQLSWANPSTIPTYGEQLQGITHHDVLRLPEQEIPEWTDGAARRLVLSAVSKHYHRHN